MNVADIAELRELLEYADNWKHYIYSISINDQRCGPQEHFWASGNDTVQVIGNEVSINAHGRRWSGTVDNVAQARRLLELAEVIPGEEATP